MKSVVLAALLLAMPMLVLAPSAEACASVPCGRIYPNILLQFPEGAPREFDVRIGVPLEIEATLTYRFDMQNDGYTVAAPNEPVFVTFEFPRKPGWADLKVEPEKLEVPVNDPRYFQATPDANAPQLHYVWTAPIKITATVTGQAVLKDGYDYGKLLVFAKSSESGLYQSGYGIKEVRVVPEGALHESDVAGLRDTFAAQPLPAVALAPVERSFGGLTVTLTPPAAPRFWTPQRFEVALSPAPQGRVFLALHDEAGNLVASDGPMEAAPKLGLNATLAMPGLHTVTATLLPAAGTDAPPMTFSLPFLAGALDAEGFVFEKSYLVQTRAPVPTPGANAAEPLVQWERDVPFFAFDNAQSVSILFTLSTPLSPLDPGRGLANVQLVVLDPDGNLLAQNSVDPVNPQKPIRLGSVPQEGWFVLRLRGAGAPEGATWDARIEVVYPAPPQARNRADGVADETGATLRMAGRNLTLPLDVATVWQPSDATPALEGAGAMSYAVTVEDGNGSLVYASGLRASQATLTPPAPGAYRAFVYAEPGMGAFPPLARAFAFSIGAGQSVTAAKFPVEDAPLAPTSPREGLLSLHVLPQVPQAGEGVAESPGARTEVVDEADGAQYLRILAANPGPPRTIPVSYALEYDAPVTLEGPGVLDPASGAGLSVPGAALGAVLVLMGTVAVGAAFVRRP